MATAGQRDFDVVFPFISTAHVSVMVNGLLVPQLEWIGPARLRLAAALTGGERVVIERNTPIEQQLVKFQSGAVLTEEDLNTAVLQLLYKQQEITGLYDGSLRRARIRILEAAGVPITADDVATQVAAIAAENALLDDFRQRIADLDANGASILDLAVDIADLTAEALQINGGVIDLDQRLTELTTDHEALAGVVAALGDLGSGEGIGAVIQNEADARIAGDTALAAVIALIGAKSGDSSAFILDLSKVKVSPTESLGSRLSAINATTAGNTAAIQNEATVRATADLAEAQARTSLASTLRGETAAAISSEQETRADADEAEATARTALAATLRGETAAAIQNEATVRSNADAAEAAARSSLAATLRGETNAVILTEQNARASGDAAEATSRGALGVAIRGELAAAIQTEQTARANADTAETNARTTLAATLRGETSAAITTEQTARVAADNVFVGNFTLMGARSPNGQAWRLDDTKVQLSNGTAIGTRLSGFDTQIAGNSAAIVTEQNARTNADAALASQITTLSTTVGGNTTSITSLMSTTNGLSARYGVAINANGYITGFVQNNNGTTGTFDILADTFRVVMPGVSPRTVFSVDADGVTMTGDVRINGSLVVQNSLPTTALPQASISNSAYVQALTMTNLFSYAANTWTDVVAGAGSTGGGGGSGGTGEYQNQV